MSQTDTTNKVATDGTSADGGTTGVFEFQFDYPVAEETDLQVIVVTEATGAESIKAITTNYTVVVADDKSSATVTFVAGQAPLSTEAVILNRVTPITQGSQYALHSTIESDLDKSAQIDLSQQEQINRCLKVSQADGTAHDGNSDTVFTTEIPSIISATALDVLQLNATKDALEWTTANASNATHTGQVTGSGALTVDVTAISDQTLVTAASGDMVLIEDATDGALKRADIATFLDGAGDALVANPLSQFAATTSAQLASVISNETGSGLLVFATSPTLTTPILGTPTSGTLTNCTGYVGDSSLVTTGALNSGSITSGFGNIDTGSSTITTTGKVTAPLVQSGGVTLATTATKAPALGDEGGYFVLSDGSAVAVTIPANDSVAFAIGTEIHFEQGGAGAITVGITAGSPTNTLNVNANLTKVTNGQYSVCTIKKTSATTWTIFGNLVPA